MKRSGQGRIRPNKVFFDEKVPPDVGWTTMDPDRENDPAKVSTKKVTEPFPVPDPEVIWIHEDWVVEAFQEQSVVLVVTH